LFWLTVSMLCFAGAVYFWRLGDRWAAQKRATTPQPTNQTTPEAPISKPVSHVQISAERLRLLSQANDAYRKEMTSSKANKAALANYRLSNTTEPLDQLLRRNSAISLENAVLDTRKSTSLPIPDALRSQGDPGTYIVQSHGLLDEAFRARLKAAGATIEGYVPNNAYLVRGSADVVAQLGGSAQVIPFEPYYKLKPYLLRFAVEERPLPDNTTLNVLVFPDAREATITELNKLGAQVLEEDRSPFGPVLRVQPQPMSLAAVAGLSGVHEIEVARSRVPANDLSRLAVGVSTNSVTTNNYLDLDGSGTIVAMADTGVDVNHPDLQGRVFRDFPGDGIDPNGHGTFVAGIIAGSGLESTHAINASGSILPPVDGQFRGKAPNSTLLSMNFARQDYYLQERAARTNALISNNSWTYGASDYDLAAAGYDAAVRDSIPERTGSQGLVYVFPSGNGGSVNQWDSGVNDGGDGGVPDTIQSPGTAKNVITVGAVEQARFITNLTWMCQTISGSTVCTTNMPWFGSTDSTNQVAGFSGRGNVGIGVEGVFGRFKPDVVAPGTFVVSTRSGQWDEQAYYNPTNYDSSFMQNLIVLSNNTYSSGLFVPENAVQMVVTVFPTPPVTLGLSVTAPDGTTTVGNNNQVSLPPDGALNPVGDFWTFTVSNDQPQQVTFDMSVLLVTTNDHGNFLEVLSNLNNTLNDGSPYYYRYESGSSLAAGDASGVLALMQEFLEQRTQGFYDPNHHPSPALMKALLINGARSVSEQYDFQVKNGINYEGWGQINLPTTLPGALSNLTTAASSPAPMYVFDQSPTNALATGQSHTRFFKLSDTAQGQPLRVTVVWTDPPGDPVVGVKLVNDLDLIVTNIDTGEIFIGNDILSGNDFNLPWNTNSIANIDVVNNVENVYLKQPLATNYSVTVVGRRVNVNAVTAHTNDVVQDYALVVSSGDVTPPDALTLGAGQFQNAFAITPNVLYVTNQFPYNPDDPITGGMFTHQRVGANSPLLGTNTIPLDGDANAVITAGQNNQWHFYMLSNEFNFTNATFITFLPPELAVPRMGVTNLNNVNEATRVEADIDMYVSTNPGLTNLDRVAIEGAFKSVGRGGTEFVALSNAVVTSPSGIYYVGIKSEDQQAADYTFLGVFSLFPPSTTDTNGNVYSHAWPVPAGIPPGNPPIPGGTNVVALVTHPIHVRRVVVTNTFAHSLPGNLIGTLSHAQKFAVLNNHTCATDPVGNCITTYHDMVYEDNGEGDILFARRSNGPGTLKDFIGKDGIGVWNFAMVNNFPSGTGVISRFLIKLEPQNNDTNGVITTIPPHSWYRGVIDVPTDATNLTICVSGNNLQVDLYVSRGTNPELTSFDYLQPINPPGGCLSITVFDTPPLTPGTYYYGVYNNNTVPQTVRIVPTVFRNPFAVATTVSGFAGPVTIADDAITYAYITNLSHFSIGSLDVGLLISDPRISDLAITLISPNGTRILLFENRGAWWTNGLGTFSTVTNAFGLPTFGSTNMAAFYTNDFDDVATGPYTPGAVFDGWSVLSNYVLVYPEMPAPWLSNNVLLLAEGSVSNNLPTVNSDTYQLSFQVTHAPYLVGTVGWWPFDGNAADIFSGLDGLLLGDVSFNTGPGMVNQAFWGDGVATRMLVPRCPQIDVGQGRGFSVEGWINPGTLLWSDGFENTAGAPLYGLPTGSYVDGWHVDSGDIDLEASPPYEGAADTGSQFIDLNGYNPGSISTNFNTIPGTVYQLNFAYCRNPNTMDSATFVANMIVSLTGQPARQVLYGVSNTLFSLNWAHTSIVFTASSPVTTLQLTSQNPGNGGMFLDSFSVTRAPSIPSPIVEWYDTGGISTQGVQFWYGIPGSATPNPLWANIRDTNGVAHTLSTGPNILTPGLWQHVALTFDAATSLARIYTNGELAVAQVLPGPFTPRTSGDLYFGFHPGPGTNFVAYPGGLDEFGLYDRPLSDCEVAAIFRAGSGGKYGTNVLSCPVTNTVELITDSGVIVSTFVNGLNWANGPQWETNVMTFSGQVSNSAPIIVTPLDPNVAVDNFILSSLVTNYVNGLMHFNEDTNVSLIPIKFAPSPYAMSNFPPTLIFSNEFELAATGIYQTNTTIPGTPNNPIYGPRDWTVVSGPVTVLSNALVDATGTNVLALAGGGLQCVLPTVAGHRYQLDYTVRGPGAVSWWTGDIEPLSQRAWDLLGGNSGAFINLMTNLVSTTNSTPGFVGAHGLYFNGLDQPGEASASKLEIADPSNLWLTNGFTIEGWIEPVIQINYFGTEQILFRGDTRDCFEPYYLALEPYGLDQRDLHFHIQDQFTGTCGFDLYSTNGPIQVGTGTNNGWWHIAAVFDKPFTNYTVLVGTNLVTVVTNQLRLYLNGVCIASNYTTLSPFRDLAPAFRPGITLGNRSRYDFSQPYRGYMDEITVYGRPLTDPEISAIYGANNAGKADHAVPPGLSLAKVSLSLDGIQRDIGYGPNGQWTTRSVVFTADHTNTVLTLQSLLPGTMVDGIDLTELPAELNYLPEESLAALNGEDAYGVWRLEMVDARAGGNSVSNLAALLNWQLNFVLTPSNPPPVIQLVHGIAYTNTIPAHGYQNFVVNVPQWALFATNTLLFANQFNTLNPLSAGVLFDLTNQVPTNINVAIVWPPAFSGSNVLNTSTALLPYIVPGQPYYLTITNPNLRAITFAYEVDFDITSLTNCQPLLSYVSQAGIPRYFQFDVTNVAAASPQEVAFLLTGVPNGTGGGPNNFTGLGSNVTVVLSEHLPLPDLTHFDYIHRDPSTNNDLFIVLTNTTPFPVQTNRWYVGVFNHAATNVPFMVQACYTISNSPYIIPLTNGVPFVADFASPFVAPPGPPQSFFFQFAPTNSSDGILFEMYNLSGDADLVLQRDVPPTIAPYLAGSFTPGLAPEQIVLRAGQELPDLMGNWYLGVFNNESVNVAYTLRAVVKTNGLLNSAQPTIATLRPMAPPHGLLLQWNSVIGEGYEVEHSTDLINWAPVSGFIRATTPLTTFEIVPLLPGAHFYRIIHVPAFLGPGPMLLIQFWPPNQLRLSWSTNYPGETLQSSPFFNGPWSNVNRPVNIIGPDYVVFVPLSPTPLYFRLVP
jgi:subtilisin-like proprotein convertase family protein